MLRALAVLLLCAGALLARAQDALPRTLRETGHGAPGLLSFSPQYPLWSDGADKQRFIALPPGASIDASNPDAWQFPRGTKLWKTFSHAGRPVETRFIERAADGQWRFAAYAWSADGREAELVGARGTVLAVRDAPGGRYAVPSRGDCLACHGGAATPVLGFAARQLAPELPSLVARGLVRGLPQRLIDAPPAIAAASAIERAALGTLHGNCAHCHHAAGGQVPVRLNLMQRVADPQQSAADVLRSLLDTPTRYQPGETTARAVVPGDAAASVLLQRMRARDGRTQMPPLGTDHPDAPALALLAHWITHDLPHRHH
jgi:Planctomycete cytochrome C